MKSPARGGIVGEKSAYYRDDGTCIAGVRTTNSSGWNTSFGLHRADLVDILVRSLPEGVVQTDHRCTGFTQDEDTATLTFANGIIAQADLVIVTNGIHSKLKQYVLAPSTPVFSGSIAHRGTSHTAATGLTKSFSILSGHQITGCKERRAAATWVEG
jgi:salicylate hydroxylase